MSRLSRPEGYSSIARGSIRLASCACQCKITPSTEPAVAKYEVTIPENEPGLHITASAARLSDATTHNFGRGATAPTSPTANPRITTANTVRITASGPAKGSPRPRDREGPLVSGYCGAGGVTVWDTNNAKTDTNSTPIPTPPGISRPS